MNNDIQEKQNNEACIPPFPEYQIGNQYNAYGGNPQYAPKYFPQSYPPSQPVGGLNPYPGQMPDNNCNSGAPDQGPVPIPSPEMYNNSSEEKSCLECIPLLKGETERIGFIRKVYALLFIQLSISCIFIGLTCAFEELRDFMRTYWWIYLISSLVTIGISLLVMFKYALFKKVPTNYILLFTYTIFESYTVANICCYYDDASILEAGVLTLAISISLSLYSCFTKEDFTKYYHGLLWVCIAVLIVTILFLCIYPSRYIFILLALVVGVLAGIFLIADTQLIIGGHKYELSYDDYVIGVLLLYSDIITLFLGLGLSKGVIDNH